ncbi:expansin-like protein [Microdochium trichocladiopsis]|uniref:Expansin-like protein n=1 Tax=Microdochium trichocladiopsis TaxID=1682393 RepID=A0A9P8XVI4_9PEZI|nr:expansin-like protein [Microdochium trichocladiopsis]KAH7020914.1 expansin-like protein [Microdochium trichocladiopsis]
MVSFTQTVLAAATLASAATAYSGQATWYEPGLGACGRTNNRNDLIAAIAPSFFTHPNPNLDSICGRKAKVTRGSKTVVVTIVDKCMSCPQGNIDLSPAAFQQIGNLDEGRVSTSWVFV